MTHCALIAVYDALDAKMMLHCEIPVML